MIKPPPQIKKHRSDEVRDHVELLRLFELAEIQRIIHEPECEHIQDCADCGNAFIVLTAAFRQSKWAEGRRRFWDGMGVS
jgi:hypothetical protein